MRRTFVYECHVSFVFFFHIILLLFFVLLFVFVLCFFWIVQVALVYIFKCPSCVCVNIQILYIFEDGWLIHIYYKIVNLIRLGMNIVFIFFVLFHVCERFDIVVAFHLFFVFFFWEVIEFAFAILLFVCFLIDTCQVSLFFNCFFFFLRVCHCCQGFFSSLKISFFCLSFCGFLIFDFHKRIMTPTNFCVAILIDMCTIEKKNLLCCVFLFGLCVCFVWRILHAALKNV